MTHCIAAFTPTLDECKARNYVPYINASEIEEGKIRVIVRSLEASSEASIEMTREQWFEFLREANTHAAKSERAARPEPEKENRLMSAHGEFAHTEKQSEIMHLLLKAVDAGAYLSFKTLREKLSYKASKQAILCSVKFLEAHGFVEKKKNGNRTMELKPTAKAYMVFRSMPAPASIAGL